MRSCRLSDTTIFSDSEVLVVDVCSEAPLHRSMLLHVSHSAQHLCTTEVFSSNIWHLENASHLQALETGHVYLFYRVELKTFKTKIHLGWPARGCCRSRAWPRLATFPALFSCSFCVQYLSQLTEISLQNISEAMCTQTTFRCKLTADTAGVRYQRAYGAALSIALHRPLFQL